MSPLERSNGFLFVYTQSESSLRSVMNFCLKFLSLGYDNESECFD